jgi:hypothetical protein
MRSRLWAGASVLGSIAAASLLAACSGNENSQLARATATLTQRASVVAPTTNVRQHAVSATHPIKPNCCAYAKTLFISDSGDNEVQIYAFPSNTYIGELPQPPEGFSGPTGMCSDTKGNVYITNSQSQTIDEYSHGGTYVRALSDPNEQPIGCAFDKSSGSLAVSNTLTTSDGAGSLAIYTKASGRPRIISGGGFQRIFFPAYAGNSGVLYFDGMNSTYATVYGALRHGKITQISIKGATIDFPGTVNWSAKTQTMNIGDQETALLYQISPTGEITGSMPLGDALDIPQGTIKGSRFVGPDAGAQNVKVISYPGGRLQTTLTGLSEPIGSAVSPDVPENANSSDL